MNNRKTILYVLLVILPVLALASGPKDNSIDWEHFGRLAIQYEGRIKPLDSFARHLLLQFSGRESFKTKEGRVQAINWLGAVIFKDPKAKEYPVFLVESPEILDQLSIEHKKDRDRYPYSAFEGDCMVKGEKTLKFFRLEELALDAKKKQPVDRDRIQEHTVRLYDNLREYKVLINSLAFLFPEQEPYLAEVKKQLGPNPSFIDYRIFFAETQTQFFKEKDQAKQAEQRKILQSLEFTLNQLANKLSTGYFSIFPPIKHEPHEGHENHSQEWIAPWEIIRAPSGFSDPRQEMVKDLSQMYKAYHKQEWKVFNEKLSSLHLSINSQIEPKLTKRIAVEAKYNRLDLFDRALAFYIACMILCFLSWMGRGLAEKILYGLTSLFLVLGFLAQSYGMVLRMQITNRPPVTNLYETIIFAAWGCVLTSFVVEIMFRKSMKSLGVLSGAVAGIVLLFVAGRHAAEGDTMGVLVAVLKSNFWLTTHVITITIGYSACLLAGTVGHVFVICQFFPKIREKYNKDLYRTLFGAVCLAALFSFVGTVLGGLWADQSWGRFWGWDPKENGALLIVLWNSILLHARSARFIKDWGLALGAIFGNIVVVMAWWGVNLLNIGLHTYGFTSGLGTKLMIFSAIEMAIIAIGLGKIALMRNLFAGNPPESA